MLDSLVRVSRRVLKVPKAVASLTGNLIFKPVLEHHNNQQLAKSNDGTRSALSEFSLACDGYERIKICGLIPYEYRRVAGQETPMVFNI